MPKIGFMRGAHLLNCMSGGKTIQKATNHLREHALKVILDTEVKEIEVPSMHFSLLSSGPTGIALGWAQQAFLKESDGYKRRYTSEERRAEWDDEEIVYYGDTRSLCVQFNPTQGNAECQEAVFKLVWQTLHDKI